MSKKSLMLEIIEEARRIAKEDGVDLYVYQTDEERMMQSQEYHYDQGFTKGYDKSINEMIINMHNYGIPIDTILKYTKKSSEEVKAIIDKCYEDRNK